MVWPNHVSRHRRELLTRRQRFELVIMNVAALAQAIVGIAQLAGGHWLGLLSLACSAGLLALSGLLLRVFRQRNTAALVAAIMAHDDDDPHCPCRWCEDARAEGYGSDVN